MQSNKNSCVEKEIAKQPEQSGARDHERRRRSCETEQQTVAWRAADRSRAKRRRTAEDWSATSPRDAAAETPREP